MRKIVCTLLTFIFVLSLPLTIYASPQENPPTPTTAYSFELKLFEQELLSNDTNVESELENAIEIFTYDLNNTDNLSDQKKLQALIDETYYLLDIYQQSSSSSISPQDVDDANATIVAAVCAYFSSNNYLLAYELLLQAEKNTTLNSTYVPYYGSRVNSSPVISTLKRTENLNTSGSSAFPNTGNAVQKDLYYAIHSFNYSFTSAGFIITDLYDFEKGDLIYTGIENIAVETMYRLQLSGYLTPFYIRIKA